MLESLILAFNFDLQMREMNFENRVPEKNDPYKEIGSNLSEEQKLMSMAGIKEIIGPAGGASGGSFVELNNGEKAVFKPYGARRFDEKRIGYIKHEIAAYAVDRFLDLGMVPLTTVAKFDGKIGSLQKMVSEAKEGSELEEGEVPDGEMLKIGIFDCIIGNTDRSDAYLVSGDKISLIDHGFAFTTKKAPTGLICKHLSAAVSENLRTKLTSLANDPTEQDRFKESLQHLLEPEEMNSIIRRISALADALGSDGRLSPQKIDPFGI